MRYIFTIAFTFLVLSVFAQKEIKLEEVKNHIGDSVKGRNICNGLEWPRRIMLH
jgi:hypothetical protein